MSPVPTTSGAPARHRGLVEGGDVRRVSARIYDDWETLDVRFVYTKNDSINYTELFQCDHFFGFIVYSSFLLRLN